MKLCHYIIFTTVALFFLTKSYGQGREDKIYSLFKIKQEYKQINEYNNYKIVLIDNAEDFLENNTDGGASLKGLFKGDSLKKIIEWVGLSNKVIQNEFYFKNDSLIFVYSSESKYQFNDNTKSFDYSKLVKVFGSRYYYNNEHLIDVIINDPKRKETKTQDAFNLLKSSKQYLKLLKAKRT